MNGSQFKPRGHYTSSDYPRRIILRHSHLCQKLEFDLQDVKLNCISKRDIKTN